MSGRSRIFQRKRKPQRWGRKPIMLTFFLESCMELGVGELDQQEGNVPSMPLPTKCTTDLTYPIFAGMLSLFVICDGVSNILEMLKCCGIPYT